MDKQVELKLMEGWLRARSIARGLPLPVPDRGGLRVDTGLPNEQRRYVFTGPSPAITELARDINEPRVFIKMCGTDARLLSLVTPKWRIQPGAYLMTKEAGRNPVPSLPPGYWLQLQTQDGITTARIFAEDDTLAASGYAAEYEGVFVYDRITTVPEHQHQGLGAAVMAALGTAQLSQAAQRVLVATEAGRGLYLTIGWSVRSHYSTVAITPPF
ncbi:GNAT family N-acetyltransferase [Duganella sacchari]|nr:GNAT family N-acetyltransferase [Duganella sacchari]